MIARLALQQLVLAGTGMGAGPAVLTLCLAAILGCSEDSSIKKPSGLVLKGASGTQVVDRLNEGVTSASGDSAIAIRVHYPDGTPASGLAYRLDLPLSDSTLTASTGTLSESGEAHIDGLAGGDPPVIYYLHVESAFVGLLSAASNRKENRFDFLLPAKEQMRAPDLPLVDLETGEEFRLSDLRGQVVFLKFFTTRCAPCQPELAKLNKLLERRGDEWMGKAAILAVGLDAVLQQDRSVDEVHRHLRREGWNRLRPLVPNQAFSWEGSKRLPFGGVAFPHAFLIACDGTILWTGHPGSVDPERRIHEILSQ